MYLICGCELLEEAEAQGDRRQREEVGSTTQGQKAAYYIGLARKFIHGFPDHLIGKPKWVFWPTQYIHEGL